MTSAMIFLCYNYPLSQKLNMLVYQPVQNPPALPHVHVVLNVEMHTSKQNARGRSRTETDNKMKNSDTRIKHLSETKSFNILLSYNYSKSLSPTWQIMPANTSVSFSRIKICFFPFSFFVSWFMSCFHFHLFKRKPFPILPNKSFLLSAIFIFCAFRCSVILWW